MLKKTGMLLITVALTLLTIYATSPVQAQAPALSGVVRVGTWDSADALTPHNNAIAAFQKAYPNVQVKLESVPQDYGTKLLAEFAAGNAPDVFQVGDGDVAKFQKLGVAENLDPYIKGNNPLDMSVFFPAVADFGKVGGGTYYLTKDYSPLMLYYNADQFKEAGVQPPTDKWTWDDMLKAAQALTKDSNGNNATSPNFDPKKIVRWGLQIPASWNDWLWTRGILPLVYQNGGKLISDDGKTTTGFMNSKETVAALQWYVDLFLKYHVSLTLEQYNTFGGADLFSSGTVSMLWNGRWPLPDFIKAKKVNFGTAGLPSSPSGTRANALCWAGFAMYTKSQNKDAAWAYIKFVAAEDGAKAFADYAFTDVKAIADAQGLSTDKYNAPIIADLANAKQIPDFTTPFWADCGDKYFKSHLEEVFLKGVAVQDAMDAAAKDADACLASQK